MARLLSFFLVFALFLVFIILNLDNKCGVNLGFITFNEVPVYITAFGSLLLGMVFAIPFLAPFRKGKSPLPPAKNKGKKNKPRDGQDEISRDSGSYDIN